MKLWFEEFPGFIQHMKSNTMMRVDKAENVSSYVDEFTLAIEYCQPFVFYAEDDSVKTEKTFSDNLDLPFEVCSFELADGIMKVNAFNRIRCFIAIDSVDGIDFWVLQEGVDGGYHDFVTRVNKETKDQPDSPYYGLCSHLSGFLKKINSKDYQEGSERVRRRLALPGKSKRRVGNVIHIVKKKCIPALKTTVHIEFTHRFLRRGHWRKLNENQTGKNRDGKRSERGRTWVNHCEVGGKDLPLIRKTRVIG